MKKNIFIIMLIIVILGLSSYLIYDKKFVPKNDDIKENGTQVVPEIIDAMSNKTYYTVNGNKVTLPCDNSKEVYISVTLPKIDSNLPGAIALNEKIMESMKNNVELANKKEFSDVLPKNYIITDITYNTILKDRIIYILVNQNIQNCGSFGGKTINSFMYDYNSDKEYKTEDVMNKYNISLKSLKNEIVNQNPGGMLESNESYKETFNKSTANDFNIIDINSNEITFGYLTESAVIKIK